MANRKYDYDAMEAEYVASDSISIASVARAHGVASGVMTNIHEYARRHRWAEKRTQRKMHTEHRKIEILGDRMARRQATLEDTVDKVIDLINESLDKLRRDMRDTPDSVRITARDLALLADRVMVLRGQPSQITEERQLGLSLSGSVGAEQLKAILELTAGVTVTDPGRPRGSAIPRAANAREV